MKTITTNVYSFNELSAEAQNNAIENFRGSDFGDINGEERAASYRAASKIYEEIGNIEATLTGARLYAWVQNNIMPSFIKRNFISKHAANAHRGIIFENSYFAYKYNECLSFRISRIFSTNTLEECPLTGVCYDYDFLQPLIDYIKKPDLSLTNEDLAKLLPNYSTIAERDQEYYSSDEYIREELENGEQEFLVNGEEF